MNVKKIAALSLVALAVGFSSAKAAPWRHGNGWVRPRVAVAFSVPAPRIFVPPVPVIVEGTYYGQRPHHVAQYRQDGCSNGGYNRGYYDGGYNRSVNDCNNGYNSYNNHNGYYNNSQYNGNGYNNGYNKGCRR